MTKDCGLRPFIDLLAAGAPLSHISQQAQGHLAALQALPDDTEDKPQALEATRRLLGNIQSALQTCGDEDDALQLVRTLQQH